MRFHTTSHRRIQAGLISLIVGIILFCAKLYAYNLTHSSAIYSDALEGIVNIIASLMVLASIIIAAKPADQDHPYGHGKIEFVSAVIEGFFIVLAAVAIGFQAVHAFLEKTPIHSLGSGLWIVGLTGTVNLGVGLFLIRQGKRSFSDALMADGKHLISDFMTSVGVLIGLGAVMITGIEWIDKATAVLIAILLGVAGVKVVYSALNALLDAQSLPHLRRLLEAFNVSRTPPVIHIHHLRVIRSGGYLHVDAHVCLPEFWTLEDCHQTADRFEKDVLQHLPQEAEFHMHLDPCRKAYCSQCMVEPCPIRKESFKKTIPFELDKLLLRDEDLPAYR